MFIYILQMRLNLLVCEIIETESSTFKAQNLSFKIIVGGAPVTQEFADAIAADGYGDNAPGAVEQVNRFAHAEEKAAYFFIFQSYCIY